MGGLNVDFTSQTGFDVFDHLRLRSNVCLIESELLLCTSQCWLHTRIKGLYCMWAIKIFTTSCISLALHLMYDQNHFMSYLSKHFTTHCAICSIRAPFRTFKWNKHVLIEFIKIDRSFWLLWSFSKQLPCGGNNGRKLITINWVIIKTMTWSFQQNLFQCSHFSPSQNKL